MALRNIQVGDVLNGATLDMNDIYNNYRSFDTMYNVVVSFILSTPTYLVKTDKGNSISIEFDPMFYGTFGYVLRNGTQTIWINSWGTDESGQYEYPQNPTYTLPDDFGTVTEILGDNGAYKLLYVDGDEVKPKAKSSLFIASNKVDACVLNSQVIDIMAYKGEVIYQKPESVKIVSFADGTDEEIAAMLDAHYRGGD